MECLVLTKYELRWQRGWLAQSNPVEYIKLMHRLILRAMLVAAYFSLAMAGGMGLCYFSVFWPAAPYLFGSTVLFSFLGDYFEKPLFERLNRFVIGDVFTEQEKRGIRAALRRYRADGFALLGGSVFLKFVLAICGGALLKGNILHISLVTFVGYAAWGAALLVGIFEAVLWFRLDEFCRSHEAEKEKRSNARKTFLELHQAAA